MPGCQQRRLRMHMKGGRPRGVYAACSGYGLFGGCSPVIHLRTKPARTRQRWIAQGIEHGMRLVAFTGRRRQCPPPVLHARRSCQGWKVPIKPVVGRVQRGCGFTLPRVLCRRSKPQRQRCPPLYPAQLPVALTSSTVASRRTSRAKTGTLSPQHRQAARRRITAAIGNQGGRSMAYRTGRPDRCSWLSPVLRRGTARREMPQTAAHLAHWVGRPMHAPPARRGPRYRRG